MVWPSMMMYGSSCVPLPARAAAFAVALPTVRAVAEIEGLETVAASLFVLSVTVVSVSGISSSAGVSGSGTASVVTLIVVPSVTLAAGRVYSPLSLAVTSDSTPSEVTALTEAIC